MGLLSKVSDGNMVPQKKEPAAVEIKNVSVPKKSSSIGLLKKSLVVSDTDKLDFFKFSSKYNFDFCAILIEKDGLYCIEQSCGFDGASICNSLSTRDFWGGIISMRNELFQFSKKADNIQPFYQFFSQALIDKINFLNVIKYDEGKILFFATSDEKINTLTLINDIKSVDKFNEEVLLTPAQVTGNDFYLYKFDFAKATEAFIKSNQKTDNADRLINAISNQIYYNLSHNFPLPSRIKQTDKCEFLVAICLKEEIPSELIINHILFDNAQMLEKFSNLISGDYIGKTNSYEKLSGFLQAD